MPNFSPFTSAYSRHSSRTTHARHTAFASRVDAPRSGKNKSGSTPRQLACTCHVRSPMSKRCPRLAAISIGRPPLALVSWHRCNYNNVIIARDGGARNSRN
jgi:hypothetical protein